MKAVILAAGVGSRLGKSIPKCLTNLVTGETILSRQVGMLSTIMSLDDVFIVVGYKKEVIMEAFPRAGFFYNEAFVSTNTAKSLLLALRKLGGEDVIWLNGDVVFDQFVLHAVADFQESCMAVNATSVSEEEVKYKLQENGAIHRVSKQVESARGEAVGINKISATHLPLLIESLERCENNDYFERGIELAIERGMDIFPVDISGHVCVEIDFERDLENVNHFINRMAR